MKRLVPIVLVSSTFLVILLCGLLYWARGWHRFPRFDEDDAADWHAYGGDWHLQDEVFSNRADGRGDKLVAGPVSEGNYDVSADLRFDTAAEDPTFGDAGLLLRVMDPTVGVDALRGYYAARRLDDHVLLIGAMSFGFRELATTSFPHELRTGHWYHLTFTSQGCTFHVRAEDTATRESADLSYVEHSCEPLQGQVGLRSHYAKASWRNLHVRPLH